MIRTTTEELGLCIEDAHAHDAEGRCTLLEDLTQVEPLLEQCLPFRQMVGNAIAASHGDGNYAFAVVFLVGIKTGQMLLRPELAYPSRPKKPWWKRILGGR